MWDLGDEPGSQDIRPLLARSACLAAGCKKLLPRALQQFKVWILFLQISLWIKKKKQQTQQTHLLFSGTLKQPQESNQIFPVPQVWGGHGAKWLLLLCSIPRLILLDQSAGIHFSKQSFRLQKVQTVPTAFSLEIILETEFYPAVEMTSTFFFLSVSASQVFVFTVTSSCGTTVFRSSEGNNLQFSFPVAMKPVTSGGEVLCQSYSSASLLKLQPQMGRGQCGVVVFTWKLLQISFQVRQTLLTCISVRGMCPVWAIMHHQQLLERL